MQAPETSSGTEKNGLSRRALSGRRQPRRSAGASTPAHIGTVRSAIAVQLQALDAEIVGRDAQVAALV
jgi:hypothetical protein